MITAADPRRLASLVDEFVGIGRAVPVVLGREVIECRAVTTGGRSWQTCHSWASVIGGNLSHVTCRGAAGARHAGISGLSPPLTLGQRCGKRCFVIRSGGPGPRCV